MTGHIWEKSYPPGLSWDPPAPPPVAIESLLEQAADSWPDKVAIDFYDTTLTFAALHDLARRAAKGLQALGVGPGVNVGLHLPNTPHYVVCFFAVLMAGGRVVNFSPLAAPRELERQIVDSEVQIMITLGITTLYPQIAALKGTAQFTTLVVCHLEDFLPEPAVRAFVGPAVQRTGGAGREIDFAALIANDGACLRHPHGPLADEVAVLQYTGGTTGEPKGAMLTHANFSAVLDAYSHWTSTSPPSEDDKALLVLPLFHIYGLSFLMLLAVRTGSQMIMHMRFDPDRALADITRKKITIFCGVPTMFTALVNHPKIKEFDLSSLRMCASGGAPLPVEVLQRFRELTGVTPSEGYGLTETAPLGTLQLQNAPRPGSVGLPAPHTVIEVVDLETGTQVLPVGTKGEICFTGPQVMKGYWKKPEATAEAFRGGRFHTGDIGFIDQDGFVTLVDRKKDMILSGGFNVFPRNIEEAIYEHPAVAEVTVIGIPDAYRGQSAKAFIALKPGHAAFSFDELKAFLAERLAKYEMPTEMDIRASLPRTSVGKLSKKELVAEELAKREAGTAPMSDGNVRKLAG